MARGWWPGIGTVLALWVAIPPYLGPALNTPGRAEVADHVVPAFVVVASCVVAAAAQTTHRASLVLTCSLLVVMAGLWMTLTHVPLLAQANRGQVPWGSAVHHAAPCLAVLVFGVFWTAAVWLTHPSERVEGGE